MQSERLRYTPLAVSDIDLCIALYTDPEVTKYAGGIMDRDDIQSQMPKWTVRGGNGCIGIWCISDLTSGEKLGSVALLPMPVEKDDTDFELVKPGEMPDADVEIGYFLKPGAWGKGYATEACQRLVKFGFEQSPLHEIVATFDPVNQPSRNVLTKSGFVDHGIMPCYGETGPNYRITRNEWQEKAQDG